MQQRFRLGDDGREAGEGEMLPTSNSIPFFDAACSAALQAGSVAAEAATHRDSRQLQLGWVPCVAVGWPVDSVEAIVMGNFDCWIDGQSGEIFTGNPRLWHF